MHDVILSVQNLSVDFKIEDERIHAIQNISFTCKKGMTLALVGESGSGKSVSALSIMGLLPSVANIVSGKIEFGESEKEKTDLLMLNDKQLETIRGSKIGMIFQEPMTSLNPLMKCGKQVAETIMLHKSVSYSEAHQETIRLFEEVRLPNPKDIFERYPHELSGGQKQRVMIAIAICCKPDLLIADEPTTALDVTVQKTILDLLKELQQKMGMAILFITHDLNLVKSFADEVLILYKSECIEYGTTDEIFSNPKEKYTKGLLACRPSGTIRVKYLNTVQETIEDKEVLNKPGNIITINEFEERMETLKNQLPIFEFKNLQIWYPTTTNFFGKTTAWFKAVNGVDLSIKENETLGLVGESGCGKTTIGKAMVLLTKITNGEILYKGKNIQNFTKDELKQYKREVQIIFQDPYSSLNPRIPIGEAIKEPMDVHDLFSTKERKEKAIELLEKVGLSAAHYQRYPHEFSGGQRQRICIARTLALQPKFIICDESVSALDVSVQAQVLNLLVSLSEEFNLSYLFISHDLNVVKHISNHVAVMNKGKIVEMNDAESIYKNPLNEYTQFLINAK